MKKLRKNDRYDNLTILCFIVILFIPTVILNGSAWAQCDSIYATFVLLSLYFLMDGRYNLSIIVYGVALAFKLQAIFVLPVFLIMYFTNKSFSIVSLLWIPITNLLLYIPAWIAGRPLKQLLKVYTTQTSQYKYLVMNFPNFYALFNVGEHDLLHKAGILMTILLFAIIFHLIIIKNTTLDNEQILSLSLLSIVVATYFLPSMHDRYMYVGDVLSIIYVFVKKDKLYAPIIILFNSLAPYITYLFGITTIDYKLLSVAQLFALVCIAIDFYKSITFSAKV
ncbi:hypothetical protein [Inconstantimicrobium porci]|uniref:hypothetical protein n=1 Tax=Inconstantimicrobium porci TaxID=2652291 RepID=UPI00240931EB|nr:hypothetical protein [Inconstantimicrobium porci]